MWVTALDKDVTEAYPSIIWCCDMAGTEKNHAVMVDGDLNTSPLQITTIPFLWLKESKMPKW